MMTLMGLVPKWRYRNGTNELVLKAPGSTVKTELLLAGAGIAAIFFGIMSSAFPEGLRTLLLDYMFNPFSSSFINALNTFVGLMIFLSVVCRLLPLYIFTSMAFFVMEHGTGVFIRLWKPILLVVVLNILYLAVKVLYTALKFHVPAGRLMKKVEGPVITGLFTASSTAAYGQMLNVVDRKLGLEPAFYRFALPFINLLTGESTAVGIIAIICCLTEMQGKPVSSVWFLTVWFMGSVFSMVMPPVSGGFLVCIGAIIAQLGMADSGLAVAGILGILFDFVNTGCKIGMQLMELVLQAEHFGKLNRNILEN